GKDPAVAAFIEKDAGFPQFFNDLCRLIEPLLPRFDLEGKSYQEISSAVGMPENSVGPMLSRARRKMRTSAEE
ncbi:MAG: hypothetical protein KBB62_03565, partial [Candidatus Pacebacteria bacterium]|nr:hypothetical protein [Candidatus Paceibacterota bacterium]